MKLEEAMDLPALNFGAMRMRNWSPQPLSLSQFHRLGNRTSSIFGDQTPSSPIDLQYGSRVVEYRDLSVSVNPPKLFIRENSFEFKISTIGVPNFLIFTAGLFVIIIFFTEKAKINYNSYGFQKK